MKVLRFGRTTGLVFFVCVMMLASDSAFANHGSWGSTGYSRGSWGSRGYYRTPIRNFLFGVPNGSFGGSRGHYYGSRGYASMGSRGRSYASLGSTGTYSRGSWGSSYSYASHGASYGSVGSTSYISAPGGSMIGTTETMGNTIQGTGAESSFGQPIGSPPGVIYDEGAAPSVIENQPVPSGEPVVPGVDDANRIETPPSPGPTPADDGEEIVSLKRTGNNNAVLSVHLPDEAKIYINGRLTTTKGDERSYVSRRLKPGKRYEYRVKAVLDKNGTRIVRHQNVKLSTGLHKSIQFDFDKPAVTTLALKVPSDATVLLSGNKTAATGSIRYYATRDLKDGERWSDYEIQVSVNRNGKTITQQKTIEIGAGEIKKVAFDFNSKQVVQK